MRPLDPATCIQPKSETFFKNLCSLLITASSRLNINLEVKRIDDALGNTTVEISDFSVSEDNLTGEQTIIATSSF